MSEHGTSMYRSGCRCRICKDAVAAVSRRRREGRDGLPEDDPRHGTLTAYTGYNCRCQACKEALANYSREYVAKGRRTNATKEGRRANAKRQIKRKQEATLPTASRSGVPWTGPELELCTRDDLTAMQVAEMTGRTFRAVVQRRYVIKTDPRMGAKP